jgi:hypothetical protein
MSRALDRGQQPIAPSALGTGTPGNTNFLRGDGQWVTPPAGFSGAQTVTSANNVTLTANSPQVLRLNMTVGNRTVVLPDATTMPAGAPVFVIINAGWISFDVATPNGFAVGSVAPGVSRRFSLVDKATADGVWAVQDDNPPFAVRMGGEVIESFGADGVTQLSDTAFLISRITAATGGTSGYGDLTRTIEHRVATLSNGVLTYGSPVSLTYNGNAPTSNYIRLSSDVFVVAYMRVENSNTSGTYRARALRVTGNSIAAGTEVTISTRPGSSFGGFEFSNLQIISDLQSNAIACHWWSDFTNNRSGRVRALVVNADNSITLGSDADPGLTQHVAAGLRLAPGVFLCRMSEDTAYGGGTRGLRVISLSGTTVTFGTILAGTFNNPLLRVDDNTALGPDTVMTRSGTTALTPTALNRSITVSIPQNPAFFFDNVYPNVNATEITSAQQIIGTTVSVVKSVSFGGAVGNLRFKTAADEFISFFPGANLRYNRFKVFP